MANLRSTGSNLDSCKRSFVVDGLFSESRPSEPRDYGSANILCDDGWRKSLVPISSLLECPFSSEAVFVTPDDGRITLLV